MKTEKRKTRFLGLFLLALLLSSGFLFSFKIPSVQATAVNMFLNPGFETGTFEFYTYSGSCAVTAIDKHTGTYCAFGGNGAWVQQNFTELVAVSTITEFSAWIKVSGNPSSMIVYYGDGSSEPPVFFSETSWTYKNFTSILDAGKKVRAVRFNMIGANLKIDDLALMYNEFPFTADLENIDDDGPDWVFTDWRYYTFSATISSELYTDALDFVGIWFNVPTYNGSITCSAWKDGSDQWDFFTAAQESRDLWPIRIKAGTESISEDETVITFPIWFTARCLDVWEPGDAIDVWLAWNDTTGEAVNWFVAGNGLFRIYNKGGFTQNTTTTGTAYPVLGGEAFAMYAGNASYIYRDWWFRDVQHIKLLPEVQFHAGYQVFYISYGVDYSVGNGEWLEGWKCIIGVSAVSYTGVFASNVWINMTISWWNRGAFQRSDYVYMFYHGEVYNAPDIGRWRFWVDLWFNAINASSTGGGRINAYEYPMKDDSAVWLRWLSSAWGVKDDVEKESMFMGPLLDADGNIMSSERIQMAKFWSSLEVIPYDASQVVIIDNFDVVDITHSKSLPLTGIQTPPFDETKMPVVGNTGVLGAIFSMFAGIGKWISDNILFGGLSLWPTFVAFLDTIAGWLGAPNGFSNFLTWLDNGWTWLVDSFTYALTLIYNIFLFLGSIMYSIITTLGEAIVSFANMVSMIGAFLSGGIGGAGDLWNTLGISTWITIAIIFYPLYLIILWDQKGMDAVIKQLSMIVGIITWLKDLFITLINLVLNLVGRIIESIPVVE